MEKSTVILVCMIFLVIMPMAYGWGAYDAIRSLRWHRPELSVRRDGMTIYVTLSIKVENPTITPLPTVSVVCDVELNGHKIFYAEEKTLGGLGPHETATIRLTTAINFGLFADLFGVLVDFLAGKPVSYYIHFGLSVNLWLFHPSLFDKVITGTFELY